MGKRKREDDESYEEMEKLIEVILKKKQRKIEEEASISIPEVKAPAGKFDLEKTKKKIIDYLSSIISEDVVSNVSGHTQGSEAPILEVIFKIGFPNSISVEQIKKINSFDGVVNVSVKSSKHHEIELAVVMSNDVNLKTSYAYSDLKHYNDRLKKFVKDNKTTQESVGSLIKANLDLDNSHPANSSKDKVNHDGTKISILTYVVKGSVSFPSMNRLVQNPIILNLYFSPLYDSDVMVARFELFNSI